MFVCVCICMAFTGQMKVSEIVELELEAVGNSLMCVLGIEFGSSVRAVGALSCCQSCLLTPSPPGSEAMANPPSSSSPRVEPPAHILHVYCSSSPDNATYGVYCDRKLCCYFISQTHLQAQAQKNFLT